MKSPLFDNAVSGLLQKYNTAGPRYTSYPTAPVWKEDYQHERHVATLAETNRDNPHPLSLYTHLPFCESRCLFCGCNVVITKQRDQAEKYLDYLFRELEMTAALMDAKRPIVQFHWGGGTPTYLSEVQMERLFRFQTALFQLTPDAEVGIEVDPRVTTASQLETLKALGFNRISLGVQDFNSTVQSAINRIQPLDMTAAITEKCRELGFSGLNFDLIYGLPHQSVESFEKTVREVIALSPDRLALYSYAHVPWLSPHQAQMDEKALPAADEKFDILRTALTLFTKAGYRYIGMDHFAKPDDELSLALDNGQLHRNFMGYTVQKGHLPSDLYGFGVSAISGLQGHFAQNWRKLSQYYDAVDAGKLPVMRGYVLSEEDKLRQQVILAILCQGEICYAVFEERFGIDFKTHFQEPLARLQELETDGLVSFSPEGFTVTPLGRLLSRNIAMPFDAYLQQLSPEKRVFSKTV
ncbi:MAG TPA: oxygen-independent coproporphyrinogen III oxidase [Oculatellaceae cyanobacterium]|jgi:oxygen-independent coproporphyrinogen-3 oxidase